MKPFTVEELNAGEFARLERIETPQMGTQFDMNQLAVAAVLTLNTMLREFAELKNRNEELAEQVNKLSEQVSLQAVAPAPHEGFVLQTLSDEYKK